MASSSSSSSPTRTRTSSAPTLTLTLTKPLLLGNLVEQEAATTQNEQSSVRIVFDSEHTCGTDNQHDNHDTHDHHEPNTKEKANKKNPRDHYQYFSPSQRMTLTLAKHPTKSPTGAPEATTAGGGYHHHLYLKDKHNVDDTRNTDFCLCCMGFRYYSMTQSTGTFLCPWCNQQQSYQKKQSQKRCHVCFIPLPNTGGLLPLLRRRRRNNRNNCNTTNHTTTTSDEDNSNSYYIKCKGCHKHFRLSVLTDQDTLYQDILEQPVLEVLVQIMMLKQREQTGSTTIQPDDIEQIQRYYQYLIGRPLTMTTILHADRDDTTSSENIAGDNNSANGETNHANHAADSDGTVHWMIQSLVESIHKYDQTNWQNDKTPTTEEYTAYRFSRLQSAIRAVSLHLTARQKEALSKIMRDEIYDGNAVASLHW